MSAKVSVVVPIYKVEKYLNRCIDSILSQTYNNLEIILVDDGSPDNCGEVADEYAKKDNRIIVVHKENGGLSDARNSGIQYVTGEFTIFVDSDDWLSNRMVEIMVCKSFEYKSDIVQAAFYYAHDSYLIVDDRYYSQEDPPVVLDNKSLMTELIINEKIKNFAWGKLYRTDIIRDLPFKKGVLFEDVFWAHKVMQRVETYVILNQPLYYYYQRSDSIAATYSLKSLDIIRGLIERHCFIEQYYTDLVDNSYKLILKTSLIHYYLLWANKKIDIDGVNRGEIQTYIKTNFKKLKNSVHHDQKLLKRLYLFRASPSLYYHCVALYKYFRKFKKVPKDYGLKHIDL